MAGHAKNDAIQRWLWPFELVERIGEGAMGLVYRARFVKDDSFVAVKLLPDSVVNERRLVRFEREMDIMKSLRHPNIVRCFGGVCEDQRRFYAMELVEGGTLSARLRGTGPLPWKTVVEYGTQICSALTAAHELGVVHRDLKPSNLLIDGHGHLKLADFGLALMTVSGQLTLEGKAVGTLHYMSPEQITGQESITPQADLYALGCVLYQMLTGRPPFLGENPAAVMHGHVSTPPKPLSELATNCPSHVSTVVMELLAKQPERRPKSAAVVVERLLNPDGSRGSTSEDKVERNSTRRPKSKSGKSRVTETAQAPTELDTAASGSRRVVVVRKVRLDWRLWIALALLSAIAVGAGLDAWNQHRAVDASVERWVRALEHPDEDVRLEAATALAELSATSVAAERQRLRLVSSQDARIRAAASRIDQPATWHGGTLVAVGVAGVTALFGAIAGFQWLRDRRRKKTGTRLVKRRSGATWRPRRHPNSANSPARQRH